MPISTAQMARLRQLANDTRLSQRRRPASQRDNDALALANDTLAALDEIERLCAIKDTVRTILDLATNDLISFEQACKEIERHAETVLAPSPAEEGVT